MKKTVMGKNEVLTILSDKTEFSKKDIRVVIAEFCELLKSEIQKGHDFVLPDVCKFTVKDTPARPERVGRNPATGVAMTIGPKPASKRVLARIARPLKVAIGQVAATPKKPAAPKKPSVKKAAAPKKPAAAKKAAAEPKSSKGEKKAKSKANGASTTVVVQA